jgi:hypothetical protein
VGSNPLWETGDKQPELWHGLMVSEGLHFHRQVPNIVHWQVFMNTVMNSWVP